MNASLKKRNLKRSRLMGKSDEDILLEILVLAEKAESFCPERLMLRKRISLFEEAYRRFETWDRILDLCIALSNDLELRKEKMKLPKEVILEILQRDSDGKNLHPAVVSVERPDIVSAAEMYYGSWDQTLAIVGLR